MAKDNTKLELPEIEVKSSTTTATPVDSKKKASGKTNTKKRKSIKKFFRDIISELKKVKWASFKETKNNPGVLKQTGTVLIVVVFFMVIITLFDTGMSQLLKLLLTAA